MESESFVERLKDSFDDMVVYKDLQHSNFISSFKLPSYMRDWVLKRFQDEDGSVDVESATAFVNQFIPKKNQWNQYLDRIVKQQETVRILAKITVYIDIASQNIMFDLPDFGLKRSDTVIPDDVWEECSAALLKSEETWGILDLGYQFPKNDKGRGKIKLLGFQEFSPYVADLDEYKYARESFNLSEWVNILLGAADYNANGYAEESQKWAALQRFLPFVEKQLNLMELAPAGTGKSYFFGHISRYGWLVSGKATRAKLIYDMGSKKDGIVALRDFVALDEIREADYMRDEEIHSALQQIMENGRYTATDNHEVKVEAGIVFLGNISSSAMNEYTFMLGELPKPFHQYPFLDRIHGFIKGWNLPRMTDDLKVCSWALNSEYFSTILHELRDDASYRAIVDDLIELPPHADTRDTAAIKGICTAYLKLLFPHVRKPTDISEREFKDYCLHPAMNMRSIIRMQIGYADSKYAGKTVPDFKVRSFSCR